MDTDRKLQAVLMLLLLGILLPVRNINAVEISEETQYENAVSIVAKTLKQVYEPNEPVLLILAIANHSDKPIYNLYGETDFYDGFRMPKDVNGKIVPSGPIPDPPPPPPPYSYMQKDGERIFTVPLYEIPAHSVEIMIMADAMWPHHGYVKEGVYYLDFNGYVIIHQVSDIIVRGDIDHKLWVEPQAPMLKIKHQSNRVKIEISKNSIPDTLTQAEGDSGSDESIDSLYDLFKNEVPVAQISNSYRLYTRIGRQLFLDGSDSYDPDNIAYRGGSGITSWLWNVHKWNGLEYIFPYTYLSGAYPNINLSNPGVYKLNLQVMDDESTWSVDNNDDQSYIAAVNTEFEGDKDKYMAIGSRAKVELKFEPLWDMYNTGMGGYVVIALQPGDNVLKLTTSPTDPNLYNFLIYDVFDLEQCKELDKLIKNGLYIQGDNPGHSRIKIFYTQTFPELVEIGDN